MTGYQWISVVKGTNKIEMALEYVISCSKLVWEFYFTRKKSEIYLLSYFICLFIYFQCTHNKT